jgi:hypothetical protein
MSAMRAACSNAAISAGDLILQAVPMTSVPSTIFAPAATKALSSSLAIAGVGR